MGVAVGGDGESVGRRRIELPLGCKIFGQVEISRLECSNNAVCVLLRELQRQCLGEELVAECNSKRNSKCLTDCFW